MTQYEAENNGLGIDEMISVLMANTWKAPRARGLEGLILQQNEQLLLTYFMSVYVSDEASFATKASMMKAIEDLKTYAGNSLKTPGADRGYLLMTLERIDNRYKAKPFVPTVMPPGAPIGCDLD